MSKLRWLIALLLVPALFLGGCGFHLKRAVDIPPELNPVYIEAGEGGGAVREAMLRTLEVSQVRQATSIKEARIVVRVLRVSRSSRVAAVDRNGKVIARELRLGVTFDALEPERETRLERQTLDLSRTFENPDVEVLGKELEEELIYRDLIQDAADRILERLGAALL
jgi:LPS-assembly lipoprotein